MTEAHKRLMDKLKELDPNPIAVSAKFADNAVQEFIKKLDEFEKKSREHPITIKGSKYEEE